MDRLGMAALAAVLGLACASDGADAGRHTVKSRLAQYGGDARARLAPHFRAAGVRYPPPALTLVAIKDEARLELWAPDSDGAPRFVRDYPILAASGGPGPKLREGDLQVPEGLYGIDFLNSNSDYHLSMRITYPNAFDLARAAEEGRTEPGSAIMIHGDAVSIGCLAMGDPAVEELFTLVADTGMKRVRVILTPTDFRAHPDATVPTTPAWIGDVYRDVAAALAPLVRTP